MTVDELEELLGKATPGWWLASGNRVSAPSEDEEAISIADCDMDVRLRLDEHEANAALIAALRNAAPGLIEENRRMALDITLSIGMHERVREALEVLPEDALGDCEDEDSVWPIRNELLFAVKSRIEDARALLASLSNFGDKSV